jgi:flagellar biosynthesis/type III secretory pathway protein FliH
MSLSSSPALGLKKEAETRPFPYADAAQAGPSQGGGVADGNAVAASLPRREEEIREAVRLEEAARAQLAFDGQLEQVRDSIRTALIEFEKERATYFQKVESEVVQLALSIARKVLHREAQVDPLLLAAIVRVALDQIQSKTKVVVRVNPIQAADCRAFFARCMDPQEIPEVTEDPALAPEQCVLQTELGTTELGIEVQLKEIEQGLTDLLAQRPQTGRS